MISAAEALKLAEQAMQSADLARAEFIYQQILAAAPEEPQSLFGLGTLALRAGHFDKAEAFFRRALATAPDEPMLHNSLHLALLGEGRTAEAVASCRRAIELAPHAPEMHNNLALARKQAGDLEEARAGFERAIELRPEYADAHYNLANVLVQLRRLPEAERSFRRAMELDPEDWQSHNNLGNILQLQGRFDEAGVCFDAAVQRNPQAAEAHRNRALLRLLLGDFAGGWPEYEWRWRMPQHSPPNRAQPRWQGEPLAGDTVLVCAEQGLGDTIQFIRYAPLVQKLGARVVVECPASLHALLTGVAGVDRLVAPGDAAEPIDYCVPLLSLPGLLHTALETIPADVPYIVADPAHMERWRHELARLAGFKIGIAWQGNPKFTGDYYRSIPLAEFAPLADCAGVTLVSLQQGFGREQLAALGDRVPVVDLADRLDQDGAAFVDTAAAMMHLDLVVTSDTAIAHLAGALGVPVWVALQFAPNWRWLVGRGDSPWYPSMRLFRQSRFGQWGDVFADMAARLASLPSRTG